MAHATPHTSTDLQEQTHLGALGPKMVRLGLVLAICGLGIGTSLWWTQSVSTGAFMHAYLLAVIYFMAISFGALFFVLVQHLTRAGWSTTIRRAAEIMAAALPWLALCLLPVVLFTAQHRGDLYGWADPHVVAAEALLQKKAAYLNVPFFCARFAGYTLLWALITQFFLHQSRAQDATGDLRHTYRMQWVAAPAMAGFALSITFFAFDFIMALEPSFYSTVFGVYYFAGSFMTFFAAMIVLMRFLQKRGILAASLNKEHYHDLGKFLFGFVFFWGYIAFSQYMLIWYGNIPEETQWFGHRQDGAWVYVSVALIIGHLLLPFPGLLSRHVKRNGAALGFWALWLLAMEYLDLYWLIMPSAAIPHSPEAPMGPPRFGLLEVSLWLGMAGVFLLHFAIRARSLPLRPLKDPRLGEALAFENA